MNNSNNNNNSNTNDLIPLDYNDLPEWIQSSQLCINQRDNVDINEETEEETEAGVIILCPRKYSDFSLNIQSLNDVMRLLNITRYWNVLTAPSEIFNYLMNAITANNNILDTLDTSHSQYDLMTSLVWIQASCM